MTFQIKGINTTWICVQLSSKFPISTVFSYLIKWPKVLLEKNGESLPYILDMVL